MRQAGYLNSVTVTCWLVLFTTVISIPVGLATPLDDANRLFNWVNTHPEAGRATVKEWKALTSEQKWVRVNGVYAGCLAGDVLCRTGAPLSRQRELVYLVSGWRMPVSAYATEVEVGLRQKPKLVKSIAAVMVRAESGFAESAGQTARAKRLSQGADTIEYFVYLGGMGDNVIGSRSDSPSTWHLMKGAQIEDHYCGGFLEGIDLARARVCCGLRNRNKGFRVNEIIVQMDTEANSMAEGDGTLALFMRALVRLLEQAGAR